MHTKIVLTATGIQTNCPYPQTAIASITLHSPTPKYLKPSHNNTGKPSPYEYTSPAAILSNPKSYSMGSVGEDAAGSERYAAIEEARDEKTKREKMRVVSVQKGP